MGINMRNLALSDDILMKVEKPARYIGNEVNSIMKSKSDISVRFAAMCEECNIKFIGPSAKVIDALGNKSNARDMMIKAGVPVIPGSDGVTQDASQAHEVAARLGYPVIVKASAGGGGKS